MMKSSRVLLLGTLLLFAELGLAAEQKATCQVDCVDRDSWAFGLAVGFGEYSNPLVQGDDRNLALLPSFYYYGENFYIENTTVGYTFFENLDWSIDVKGRLNQDGIYYRDSHIDGFLSASIYPIGGFLDPNEEVKFEQPNSIDRDLSYMAGIGGEFFATETTTITANVLTDVTATHHGHVFDVGVIQQWQVYDATLSFSAGVNYRTRDLNNYYYGIKQNDFPTFDIDYVAKSGFNLNTGIGLAYPLSKHFSIVGHAQFEKLSSEISDSPLVDDSNTTFYFIGIAGHFGGN